MKVHLRALGCRLNQAEMDALGRDLLRRGEELATSPAQAEKIVVNTCSVTRAAGADSRALVREMARLSPSAAIVVTGCHAELAPGELGELPNVQLVVGNSEKERIADMLAGPQPDGPPTALATQVPAMRTRAFVKVQDGCDHACTFCVTTIARGSGRSRPLADVVAELRQLHATGVQEAVLSGVQLGSYGRDLDIENGLEGLLRALLADTDIPRLRLSSLEPWELTPSFLDLWQDGRLCRHLHLPLQSGCAATLRRMRRRCSPEDYSELLHAASERIPDMRITTDVMVGFPGEGETEFAASRDFIAGLPLAGLHVFRYSLRPGTPAARMRQQVAEGVKKERSAVLRQLGMALEREYADRIQGQTQDVLWEQVAGARPDGFVNVGYTDTWVRVRALHPAPLCNRITPALLGPMEDGVVQARPLV